MLVAVVSKAGNKIYQGTNPKCVFSNRSKTFRAKKKKNEGETSEFRTRGSGSGRGLHDTYTYIYTVPVVETRYSREDSQRKLGRVCEHLCSFCVST